MRHGCGSRLWMKALLIAQIEMNDFWPLCYPKGDLLNLAREVLVSRQHLIFSSVSDVPPECRCSINYFSTRNMAVKNWPHCSVLHLSLASLGSQGFGVYPNIVQRPPSARPLGFPCAASPLTYQPPDKGLSCSFLLIFLSRKWHHRSQPWPNRRII